MCSGIVVLIALSEATHPGWLVELKFFLNSQFEWKLFGERANFCGCGSWVRLTITFLQIVPQIPTASSNILILSKIPHTPTYTITFQAKNIKCGNLKSTE